MLRLVLVQVGQKQRQKQQHCVVSQQVCWDFQYRRRQTHPSRASSSWAERKSLLRREWVSLSGIVSQCLFQRQWSFASFSCWVDVCCCCCCCCCYHSSGTTRLLPPPFCYWFGFPTRFLCGSGEVRSTVYTLLFYVVVVVDVWCFRYYYCVASPLCFTASSCFALPTPSKPAKPNQHAPRHSFFLPAANAIQCCCKSNTVVS